jgi:hypothetical protein
MIGGCLTSGKYNMTGRVYAKTTEQNTRSGQVKAVYSEYQEVPLIARGLANLRGKDSGTEQDWGNKLDEYHYLRVKSAYKMREGDILTKIRDADGQYYLDDRIQFIVIGVTPTYEPFGSFMEYDILCNLSEVNVRLPGDSSVDTVQINSSETSQVVVI